MFIVAETAAAIKHDGSTNETAEEPSRLTRTRGPNGTISETCSLEIPREAHGVPLVIVYDALRETSSLASALMAAQRPGCRAGAGVTVFHLVSACQSAFIETQEQQQEILNSLNENGQVINALEIHDQHIPIGATPVQSTLTTHEFPVVVDYRLRAPTLGLVVRLRQRFS